MLTMHPGRVRMSVNSVGLDRLFLPGGDVWAWSRRVGRETLFESIAIAPSRTGHIKAMHGMTQTPVGRRNVRFTIHNDADYARFVVKGTTGPIRSTRPGGMLLVRPAPYSRFNRFVPLESVAGQSANNWLQRASDNVMLRHGI